MSRLSQLAMNTEGFVFDPTFGDCFTVNSTGLLILNGLQKQKSPQMIVQELQKNYDVTGDEAERDILDFMSHLRAYHLVEEEIFHLPRKVFERTASQLSKRI